MNVQYVKKIYKIYYMNNTVYLSQKDFDNGTYIIRNPGTYILSENISFNPNPNDDWMPRKEQLKSNGGNYDDFAFVFGFFAAIAIAADNVVLDLNNKFLCQSLAHRIQQRFFSCIELADQPFPPKKGPNNFGDMIEPTKNCVIKNGTIGSSSHHGIHGNNNSNITIKDVTFKEFEISAISLNKINGLIIDNVIIGSNSKNVPILGTYSAGRFIRQFAKNIIANNESEEVKKEGAKKLKDLEKELDQTLNQILNGKEVTSELYRNDSKLPDGLAIGVLINNRVNVDDFVISDKERNNNVVIKNTSIRNLSNKTVEIVGLASKDNNGVFKDSSGSVLQIDRIVDNKGYYKPNTLSEIQLFVAKYGTGIKQLGRSNITPEIIKWSESKEMTLNQLMKNTGYKYQCNGDSMHHVIKGLIGIKIDCCDNLKIENCFLNNIINYGNLGSYKDGNYQISHNRQKYSKGYLGCLCRGISIHNCKDVDIKDTHIDVVKSRNGSTIACDIFNQSINVSIDNLFIDKIFSGRINSKGEWEGVLHNGSYSKYIDNYPNLYPQTYGLRILDDSDVCIDNIKLGTYFKSVKSYKKIYTS